MNYGGAYRNTPEHLAFQCRAEDVHVVENLVVNKEQRIPDVAYFRTDADPASSARLLLLHGQEFHTSYWGHAALLGLADHYLLPEYAGYPNTAAASLYPANGDVADLAHAQGALFGYVHPFDARPDPADTTEPLTDELPVDVALGKVDYIEVMGYSDHLITSGSAAMAGRWRRFLSPAIARRRVPRSRSRSRAAAGTWCELMPTGLSCPCLTATRSARPARCT